MFSTLKYDAVDLRRFRNLEKNGRGPVG